MVKPHSPLFNMLYSEENAHPLLSAAVHLDGFLRRDNPISYTSMSLPCSALYQSNRLAFVLYHLSKILVEHILQSG